MSFKKYDFDSYHGWIRKINLRVIRKNLDGAENSDGAVVEGFDRELMNYALGNFEEKFEVFVKKGVGTVYQTSVSSFSAEKNMTPAQVYEEIKAGVAAATGAELDWKTWAHESGR